MSTTDFDDQNWQIPIVGTCNNRLACQPWRRLKLVVDPARPWRILNLNRGHLGLIPAHAAKLTAGDDDTRPIYVLSYLALRCDTFTPRWKRKTEWLRDSLIVGFTHQYEYSAYKTPSQKQSILYLEPAPALKHLRFFECQIRPGIDLVGLCQAADYQC